MCQKNLLLLVFNVRSAEQVESETPTCKRHQVVGTPMYRLCYWCSHFHLSSVNPPARTSIHRLQWTCIGECQEAVAAWKAKEFHFTIQFIHTSMSKPVCQPVRWQAGGQVGRQIFTTQALNSWPCLCSCTWSIHWENVPVTNTVFPPKFHLKKVFTTNSRCRKKVWMGKIIKREVIWLYSSYSSLTDSS